MRQFFRPAAPLWLFSIGLIVAMAMAALVPAPTALAQATADPVRAGVTNTLPALSTNTLNEVIRVLNARNVALQISFKLEAPGPSNVTFTVDRSLDGTNWLALFALPIAGNGTTTTSGGTNIDLGAFPFLRIYQATNLNTSAVSQLIVNVGTKNGL